MNGHETFEELAAVYAVGALDGDDLARFETHLAEGCDRCTTMLRDTREALTRVALADTPAVPPSGVKAALLARAAADESRPVRRRRDRASWVPWAAATGAVAAIAALITGGVVAAKYEARLGQMAREIAAARVRLQREEAALREQSAVYRGAVELLRDPATRVVELRGAGPSPEAAGRMIWNDASGGQLFVATEDLDAHPDPGEPDPDEPARDDEPESVPGWLGGVPWSPPPRSFRQKNRTAPSNRMPQKQHQKTPRRNRTSRRPPRSRRRPS